MKTYYTPYAVNQILTSHKPSYVKKDGNYIMNEAISFDIEVTSTYLNKGQKNKQKIAFMYVWMFDIFDCTIIGRTWQEFVDTMNTITSFYNLSGIKRRMIVYVHSLAYEFQFIRKWFKWIKVFSLSRRKPLYALTDTGIEFRCSYRLSGYKLEKVGKMMGIEKLSDFDYRKIRHSKTPLSPREYQYCIHDVKIVCAYIRQKMKEEDDNIAEIPLTKTGYVRRYVRNKTLKGNNRCFYKQAISQLTLETEEYLMAKRAFAGGFTHAAAFHSGKLCYNVTSFDFSSSYPAVLISEKYPMMKGVRIDEMSYEEFLGYMDREDCCIFTIELEDVEQIFPCESYISESRCRNLRGAVVNNGRVVKADYLRMDMTSVDFNLIRKIYTFNPVKVGHFYYYEKYYLPTSFVECILYLYGIKTELKGIKEKAIEYMNGKENLNALFGMCVTDIVRELIEYDNRGGWVKPEKMTDEQFQEFVSNQLDKENNKKSRFLYYLWGVFCTAYARKNLWSGIFECRSDYIYSDTDSVKILNAEKHKEYFDRYNSEITSKLEAALDYHHLPHRLIKPKNVKGEIKPLGIWDFDGFYHEFKAVRAKSYMYLSTDEDDITDYHMTVAGLAKESAVKYLKTEKAKKKFIERRIALNKPIPEVITPITIFETGMEIPASNTGKLTHTYIDDPFSARIMDYKGIVTTVSERSCIHLEDAEFHLSIAKAYADYLNGIETDLYV